jgi:hypothetical protein
MFCDIVLEYTGFIQYLLSVEAQVGKHRETISHLAFGLIKMARLESGMPGKLSRILSAHHADDVSPGTLARTPTTLLSSYYAKCTLGGVLACGLTHAGIIHLMSPNATCR